MKIHVPSIPEEGKNFHFDAKTDIFESVLKAKLANLVELTPGSQAEVKLSRTGDNVSLIGKLELPIKAQCARCNSSFDLHMEIPMVHHLIPYFGTPRSHATDEEEGIELGSDDLDFSFYHGEEIDLVDILAEEALLNQPIIYVCQEECRGLCPHCGINLNEASCKCEKNLESSPFASLKDFKSR